MQTGYITPPPPPPLQQYQGSEEKKPNANDQPKTSLTTDQLEMRSTRPTTPEDILTPRKSTPEKGCKRFTPQPDRASVITKWIKGFGGHLEDNFISVLAALTKDQKKSQKVICGSTAVYILALHFKIDTSLLNPPGDIDFVQTNEKNSKKPEENFAQLDGIKQVKYDTSYVKKIEFISIKLENNEEILVTHPKSLLNTYARHTAESTKEDKNKIAVLRILTEKQFPVKTMKDEPL